MDCPASVFMVIKPTKSEPGSPVPVPSRGAAVASREAPRRCACNSDLIAIVDIHPLGHVQHDGLAP